MTITDYAPIMAFITNLLTLLQHATLLGWNQKRVWRVRLGPWLIASPSIYRPALQLRALDWRLV